MKQTLQLKLTQHLTLTPQLQQSIRLLQLSTVELNAEVERMLQENPLLEKADSDDDSTAAGAVSAGTVPAPEPDARLERADEREAAAERTASSETRDEPEGVDRSDFEDYSSGDSDWGSGSSSDSARKSRRPVPRLPARLPTSLPSRHASTECAQPRRCSPS